jgi:hypothetical protein
MEYVKCKYIAATAEEVWYAIIREDMSLFTAVATALLLY